MGAFCEMPGSALPDSPGSSSRDPEDDEATFKKTHEFSLRQRRDSYGLPTKKAPEKGEIGRTMKVRDFLHACQAPSGAAYPLDPVSATGPLSHSREG